MEPRCSFIVIKITNKYSSTRWDNGTMLNVKKQLHGSTYSCSRLRGNYICKSLANAGKIQDLSIKENSKTYQTNHKSHTWFFTALPFLHGSSLTSLYFAAVVSCCSLATSSHLPPTSQLVQPVETPTGDLLIAIIESPFYFVTT